MAPFTHGLTEVMVACTQPTRAQANQDSSIDGGRVRGSPPLIEKLWSIDDF